MVHHVAEGGADKHVVCIESVVKAVCGLDRAALLPQESANWKPIRQGQVPICVQRKFGELPESKKRFNLMVQKLKSEHAKKQRRSKEIEKSHRADKLINNRRAKAVRNAQQQKTH